MRGGECVCTASERGDVSPGPSERHLSQGSYEAPGVGIRTLHEQPRLAGRARGGGLESKLHATAHQGNLPSAFSPRVVHPAFDLTIPRNPVVRPEVQTPSRAAMASPASTKLEGP